MNKCVLIMVFLALLTSSCTHKEERIYEKPEHVVDVLRGTHLVVLGTAQDAGAPHIGCDKDCCKERFKNKGLKHKVVSLGLMDAVSKQHFVLEASPDFSTQLRDFRAYHGDDFHEMPHGILLTHAHIGHYTGLMYLGREAKGAKAVPVYAMPKMKQFLTENGPWSQLVALGNIELRDLEDGETQDLSSNLKVIPFKVPHRDEFSETVGYTIIGSDKKALFIPDIDKWEKWETPIEEKIKTVDYAFIDGTFYDNKELPHRDMSEIPHPFIVESMERFQHLPKGEKNKIYFIHLNHSNPALNPGSAASKTIEGNGFHVARRGEVFAL